MSTKKSAPSKLNWRFNVRKGYRPALEKAMADIGVDDPRIALDFIIGDWLRMRTTKRQTKTDRTAA